MGPPRPIPLLRVAGSHREVGARIGTACADTMRSEAQMEGRIPGGRTRGEQLDLAARYRDVTAPVYPWFMEEIEGAAEATGVDPLVLFALMIEEIWYEPRSHADPDRCSDLVAGPRVTANGHLLVAHNNDMSRSYEDQLVVIEWSIPDDPVVLTIGNGLWLSVGWNSAGLSLTGNELSPNDERIGIPREIQVRAMLREPTMAGMVREALRPDRASSYNNVLTSSDGEVVNVEGSATDAELTGLSEDGTLVHTNHYVCDRMLRYEADPNHAELSAIRYRRAEELLASMREDSVTVHALREILSDHENAPYSLCRHPELHGDHHLATAFWCVADVTEMHIWYGRGNPCDSVEQEYVFAGSGR